MRKFKLHYLIGHSVETAVIQASTEQGAIETLRSIMGYVFVKEANLLPNKKKKKRKKKKKLPQ